MRETGTPLDSTGGRVLRQPEWSGLADVLLRPEPLRRVGNDAGRAAIANAFTGVAIQDGASYNAVGGTAAGAGEVISGDGIYEVLVDGTGSDFNLIAGDFIGTNYNGTTGTNGAPLGNEDGALRSPGRVDRCDGLPFVQRTSVGSTTRSPTSATVAGSMLHVVIGDRGRPCRCEREVYSRQGILWRPRHFPSIGDVSFSARKPIFGIREPRPIARV